MSNFLGIKQVLFSEYSGKTQAEKIGYLWLVRNGEGSNSFDIYFGSRKYGSNDLSVISKLHDAFGGFLSADGAFTFPTGVEFTSFNDESVNDFGDVLIALDAAVKANQDALANVYTKTEVDGLIDGVEALLNDYAKNVTVTVGEATYTGTFADNVVNVDLSAAFEAAGKVKDVTVDGTSVMSGTTAVIDLSGKANVGDAYTKAEADAKFLTGVTIPEYEIVKQETADEGYAATYYLAKDGVQVGAKINTTLDQVLKSSAIYTVTEADKPYSGAVVGDKYVMFEFQNNDTPQYLPVKDLVDVYTGSASIEVSANNVISVKEVDASLTKLSTTIEVKGGPLADDASDNWPWTDGDKKVIPSGKTMEEILTALFLKVVSGSVSWSTITYAPTLSQPVATLSKSGNVEVGTELTATANTTSTVSSNTRSASGSGTEGHFDSLTGTWKSASAKTTVSKNGDYSGTTSIKTYWNGAETTIENGATKLYATKEGANTFKVDQSGITAYVDRLDSATIYASTNTKVILTGTTAVLSDTGTTPTTSTGLTSTKSATVNAYYKYYIGFATSVPTDTAGITALTAYSGYLTKGNGTYTFPESGKITCPAANNLVIAIPSGYTVTDIVNGFDLPALSEFTTTSVKYALPNGTQIDYILYYKLCAVATEFKSIKFKK